MFFTCKVSKIMQWYFPTEPFVIYAITVIAPNELQSYDTLFNHVVIVTPKRARTNDYMLSRYWTVRRKINSSFDFDVIQGSELELPLAIYSSLVI